MSEENNHEEYDYEGECRKIREENEKYLGMFQEEMEKKGLSPRTIRTHISNVDFYLNDFLLYGEPVSAMDGWGSIGLFLGEFFIRKCMWSTPGTIKSTAVSIKKFYKCMSDCGELEKGAYRELCEDIKENMEEWQDLCAQYNDPTQESPFFLF